MGKHRWFLLSDHKLSFHNKKCVAGSSWEKMKTLWGQIIIAWPCLVSQFSCVRKWHHHFFCYLNSSLYAVWSMFSANEEGFWASKMTVCQETWISPLIYKGSNNWNQGMQMTPYVFCCFSCACLLVTIGLHMHDDWSSVCLLTLFYFS